MHEKNKLENKDTPKKVSREEPRLSAFKYSKRKQCKNSFICGFQKPSFQKSVQTQPHIYFLIRSFLPGSFLVLLDICMLEYR